MNKEPIEVQAIINPISGIGSKRKIPRMIERIYAEKSISLDITFTEYAGHAKELTKQALDRGAKCILAVGGDGTVNEIATSMIYTDAILGIIPRGSGNGLARDLNIPMDTKRAIELILKGHAITIDGCTANGHVFFTTCGVGFDATVSQKFASEKRRGSLTYVKKTVQEYLSYKPEVYELHIGGLEVKEKAFLIACANASQYGNNAFIAPHASMMDGLLDITFLSPFTYMDVPSLAFQLFTRRIENNSNIKSFQASDLTIIRQHAGLMHLDGDPVMAEKEIRVSILPQALNVFTPEATTFKQDIRNIFDQVTGFFEPPQVFHR